jgi:hypothetical protein
MTKMVKLQRKKSGHEPKVAWRQEGLIGGKQPGVK